MSSPYREPGRPREPARKREFPVDLAAAILAACFVVAAASLFVLLDAPEPAWSFLSGFASGTVIFFAIRARRGPPEEPE